MFSQFGQDLFVLSQLNNKHSGFFVEAGAYDGVEFSNTYLLEKEYGWTGILCEPNDQLRQSVIKNRESPVEKRALWSKDDEDQVFFEAEALGGIPEYFCTTGDPPEIQEFRLNGKKTTKKTITLNAMLEKYRAPRNIDYISLDTEGSELEILSSFDFDKWNVAIWTIERNVEFDKYDLKRFSGELVEFTIDHVVFAAKLIHFMKQHGYKFHSIQSGHDAYFTKLKV